jgi:GxxExxY protein
LRTEPSPELDQLAHAVIGAAIEVHRVLGPGLLESVYESALCRELELLGIPHERQARIPIPYKGIIVGDGRLDVLVAGVLPVEIKSVEMLIGIHGAQVLTYLKAGNFKLGLLINFNERLLKDGLKRVVNSD